MRLADLALAYLPANVEDRRGDFTLERFRSPEAPRFNPAPLANPMERRLPARLGSLAHDAGFSEIAPDDFDEGTSARAEAFTPSNRSTPRDDFSVSLHQLWLMNQLGRRF